jgi:hypothetical protein
MVKPDIDSATDADWSAAAEREELIAPLASTPRARLSEVDELLCADLVGDRHPASLASTSYGWQRLPSGRAFA